MKKKLLLGLIASCFMGHAFASECMTGYAAGIGHIMSGETDDISEEHSKDEVISDDFVEVSFIEGEISALDKVTGIEIEMKNISQDPSIEMFLSTKELTSFPESAWTSRGNPFLYVVCLK